MLDSFDLALLNLVQEDDSRTADQLATRVALSPSAIARRLRRLRADGWIARTIALLSARLTDQRLRALLFIELAEHADLKGKAALEKRLLSDPKVQFCYETTGECDLLVLIDCANMGEFNALCDEVLVADPTVRRYQTSFVKREVKFAPFVKLGERRSPPLHLQGKGAARSAVEGPCSDRKDPSTMLRMVPLPQQTEEG